MCLYLSGYSLVGSEWLLITNFQISFNHEKVGIREKENAVGMLVLERFTSDNQLSSVTERLSS